CARPRASRPRTASSAATTAGRRESAAPARRWTPPWRGAAAPPRPPSVRPRPASGRAGSARGATRPGAARARGPPPRGRGAGMQEDRRARALEGDLVGQRVETRVRVLDEAAGRQHALPVHEHLEGSASVDDQGGDEGPEPEPAGAPEPVHGATGTRRTSGTS